MLWGCKLVFVYIVTPVSLIPKQSSRCKVLNVQVTISKDNCSFHRSKCTIPNSKWTGCDCITIPWLWCLESKFSTTQMYMLVRV
jgi:hypothetical protein